jgi:hypothetical protein
LTFQADEHHVGALSLALGQAGIGILALTPELATLEDLFFRLTEGAGASAEDGPVETHEDPGALTHALSRGMVSGQ